MLPPFLPFTAKPVRRRTIKRFRLPVDVRPVSVRDSRSIRAARLTIKGERLSHGSGLRVLAQP